MVHSRRTTAGKRCSRYVTISSRSLLQPDRPHRSRWLERPGQLPAEQGHRNHPGSDEVIQESSEREARPRSLRDVAHETVDLDLADDVAGAVGRLLQVE